MCVIPSLSFCVEIVFNVFTASVSAFAAARFTKNSSGLGTEIHADNEISTSSQISRGAEFRRRAKKRKLRGGPQILVLPLTQDPSGSHDTPVAYCVPSRNIDGKNEETLDVYDAESLPVASEITVGQTSGLEAVVPQDNWQDRKPASLVYQLTLYSSDSEVNVLYQGPLQQLSTFTPTNDNVIGEIVEEWTIRLNEADVSTCLREYWSALSSHAWVRRD